MQPATDPVVITPGWNRARAISLAIALFVGVYGVVMLGFAWYSSMPGACGNEFGCTGGRDATPLTGIAVGSGLIGISGAWTLTIVRRVRGRDAPSAAHA